MLKANGLLLPADLTNGLIEYKNKYYGFSTVEAADCFMQNPDMCVKYWSIYDCFFFFSFSYEVLCTHISASSQTKTITKSINWLKWFLFWFVFQMCTKHNWSDLCKSRAGYVFRYAFFIGTKWNQIEWNHVRWWDECVGATENVFHRNSNWNSSNSICKRL